MPVSQERDCPKCGAPTETRKHTSSTSTTSGYRNCTNDDCNWHVLIS